MTCPADERDCGVGSRRGRRTADSPPEADTRSVVITFSWDINHRPSTNRTPATKSVPQMRSVVPGAPSDSSPGAIVPVGVDRHLLTRVGARR